MRKIIQFYIYNEGEKSNYSKNDKVGQKEFL